MAKTCMYLRMLFPVAVLLSAAHSSSAQELETAHLEYRVQTTLTACPDEESFRHQVASRLGYQPFADGGRHQVSIALTIQSGRIHGRAEVTRAGQSVPAHRDL